MKKLLIGLLSLIIVLSMCSCGILNAVMGAKEKTFEKAGLTITLTEKFYERDYVSFTAVYESNDIAVFTLKEKRSLFASYDKNMTLSKYADLVVSANNLENDFEEDDGLYCTTYEREANGKEMMYYAFVFEGDDAFWLVNIACESKNAEKLEDTIMSYAKSIVVE